MSMLSHIEDEIRDLSFSDLKIIRKIVEEQIEQYMKEPSKIFSPNYSFEEK